MPPTDNDTTDAPVADVTVPPDADTATESGTDEPSTADKIDAILRDPNVPGDVRAYYVTQHAVETYLARTEFVKDEHGVTHARQDNA